MSNILYALSSSLQVVYTGIKAKVVRENQNLADFLHTSLINKFKRIDAAEKQYMIALHFEGHIYLLKKKAIFCHQSIRGQIHMSVLPFQQMLPCPRVTLSNSYTISDRIPHIFQSLQLNFSNVKKLLDNLITHTLQKKM